MTAIQQQKKSYILPIIMMIALFAMISFVTGLQNPMAIIVKNQFHASNAMSQLGNFANFIAYAVMGIPAGLLLTRMGYKKTSLAAVSVGFVGVGLQFIAGQAGSFALFLGGAFVSGFSMCMLNTVVNPMLNTLAGGGNKGNQLIQLGGSLNSLAATIVPVLVGYLIGNAARATISDANPALFIAMGVFAVAFIVILLMQIPEPHMRKEGEKGESTMASIKGALQFRHFILGALAIFVYVGVEVGIPNISNLYMTTQTEAQAKQSIAEYEKQQKEPVYLAQLTEAANEARMKAEKSVDVALKAVADKLPNADELVKIADAEVEVADALEAGIISEDDYTKIKEQKVAGLGIPAAIAGTVVGTYWFLMLIGRLFIGATLGAKLSSKKMLSAVASLGIIFVLLAIFLPVETTVNMPVFKNITSCVGVSIGFGMEAMPISIMFLVLCGLCTSVMWGGIFNLAVEGLGKYTTMASGIFMVMVCGGGVLPFFQGLIADNAGFMSSFWLVFAGLAYLIFYAFVGSKNVNKDIRVD